VVAPIDAALARLTGAATGRLDTEMLACMVDLLDGCIQSEKGFLRLRAADPGFALAGADSTAGDGLDDSAGEAGGAGVCAGGTSRHADIS